MSARALLVDDGGVLTAPVADAFATFGSAHGLPSGAAVASLADAWRAPDGRVIGQRGALSWSSARVTALRARSLIPTMSVAAIAPAPAP